MFSGSASNEYDTGSNVKSIPAYSWPRVILLCRTSFRLSNGNSKFTS